MTTSFSSILWHPDWLWCLWGVQWSRGASPPGGAQTISFHPPGRSCLWPCQGISHTGQIHLIALKCRNMRNNPVISSSSDIKMTFIPCLLIQIKTFGEIFDWSGSVETSNYSFMAGYLTTFDSCQLTWHARRFFLQRTIREASNGNCLKGMTFSKILDRLLDKPSVNQSNT